MIYIGVDPGASGAIACLSDSMAQWYSVCRLKETERDIADWLEEILGFWHGVLTGYPRKAWIEKVHAMPRQGVSSTFKFGRSYGYCRGLLIAKGIPFEEVSPQTWQKALGCLSRGDKNVTKARAQQEFPWIKITHATADALLIAEYGRRLGVKS